MRAPRVRKPADATVAPSRRQQASEQRRQAIIEAALDVFAAEGFAAARLDEVAEKAGVAKGTIYLFFEDKDDLFEQLLISAVAPVLAKVEVLAKEPLMPLNDLLAALFSFFRAEVLGTKRREVIRLVLTEGRRFPRIAEFYHREVISKGLALIGGMARQAHKRGELPSDDLASFPHLVFAPLVMSLLWDGLFSKSEALDVEGLFAAHRRVLTGNTRATRQRKS